MSYICMSILCIGVFVNDTIGAHVHMSDLNVRTLTVHIYHIFIRQYEPSNIMKAVIKQREILMDQKNNWYPWVLAKQLWSDKKGKFLTTLAFKPIIWF